MVQGMVSGATNYAIQSLEDILLDVKKWINYTSSLRTLLSKLYTQSQNTNYWRRVHYDFKQVIYNSIFYFDRIIYDFKIIEKSIENDCINKREVELLKNIGTNAQELNRRYLMLVGFTIMIIRNTKLLKECMKKDVIFLLL